MRVIGIFRGFPGLGRVVAGVEILQQLERNYQAEVIMVSYLQGLQYAQSHSLQTYSIPDENDISSIGIIPVSRSGEEVIDLITEFLPDMVIIDGEPLLLQTIRLRFPKLHIATLLNPFDVENPHNKLSSRLFFNDCYSKADMAIVHGLWEIGRPLEFVNDFHSFNTILREEICQIEPSFAGNTVACVLGGGSVNCHDAFLQSTLKIAKITFSLAKELPGFHFNIFCSCAQVYDEVIGFENIPENIKIHKDLKSSAEIYSKARLVIARAGRNTISELLHLNIPSILFATGCRIRGSEQQTNLKEVEALSKGNIIGKAADTPIAEILDSVKELLNKAPQPVFWPSGTPDVTRLLAGHFFLHN